MEGNSNIDAGARPGGWRRPILLSLAVFVLGLGGFVGVFCYQKYDLKESTGRVLAIARDSFRGMLFTQREESEPIFEITPRNGAETSVQNNKERTEAFPEKPLVSAPIKPKAEETVSSGSLPESERTPTIKADEVVEIVQAKECDFASGGSPSHTVLINEVAWMGTAQSASDEWMELRNNSGDEARLSGWQLMDQDEDIKIIFEAKDIIPAGGLYLLERTDDTSVPAIKADRIYGGSLSNSGMWLRLFDKDCRLADEVNALAGWDKFGGDNKEKRPLERNFLNMDWHTSESLGGTPRAQNTNVIRQVSLSFAPADTGQALPPSEPASTTPPAPPVGQKAPLIITEIMAGSDGSSNYDFVELYNPTSENILLTGWYMKKRTSGGSESSLAVASKFEGKTIPAGRHLLLANDTGYTGSVLADIEWPPSYGLAYANNAVVLYAFDGEKIDEVSWAEIPKNKGYARQQDGSFVVTDPNPENSSSD